MSKTLDKISFWSLFLVVVLLPVFYFPFTTIPFETAKGFLLVLGLVTSVIFWTIARFTEGKITLPKSYVILTGFLMIVAFFLSAFYSPVRSVSMFGVMFDFGSFAFLGASFLLMTMCAVVIRDLKSAKIVLLGFVLSSTLLFLFQTLHIFFPTILSLKVLTDKTDNLMGSWNAFGLFAAFFTILSIYIIEFFKIPKGAKWVLGIFTLLALFVVVAVNFYLAWALLEVFALIVFVYKISFSYNRDNTQEVKSYFPFVSFAVFIFAMFFFIASPSISGYAARALKISNIDASPTFTANYVVAKSALESHKAFGFGLNRFGEAWALYKPQNSNNGPFWNNYFDFGRGVIPTLASVTGYVGITALLLFFLAFVLSGLRSLLLSIKDGVSWGVFTFFMSAAFLFACCFFYSTGPLIFLLAMAFTGIFVGTSVGQNSGKEMTVVFSNNPKKSFLFLFLLMGLLVGVTSLGFKYLERFASVPPLRQAVLETVNYDVAIPAVDKAISFNPNDLYYRTSTQVYLSKFVSLATKKSTPTEEDNLAMEGALDKAIKNAISATAINKYNYLNFQLLGSVYLTAGQLGVSGSFAKAEDAFKQASTLNPLSPGLKLSAARAAYLDNKRDEATSLASEALTLKGDYVDALIVMSQIKKSAGSMTEAINYAETALAYVNNTLSLYPNDEVSLSLKKDITTYLESLKNGPSPDTTTPKTTKTKTSTKTN